MRHGAHTWLRQVLGVAVRRQWIDRNDQDRELLDAYDGQNGGGGHVVGTAPEDSDAGERAQK